MKFSYMRRVSAMLAAFLCVGALAACGGGKSDGPVETAPPPAVTMPDLNDDRTFTSTAEDAARVEKAFATTEAAPASDFSYTVTDGGVTVTGYSGGESVLVIPDTIEGAPVTGIAEEAFADMGNLKAVSIPESVTAIGIGAFEGCASMTTLRTPVCESPTAPYFGALFGATSHEINGSHVPSGLSTVIVVGDACTAIPDYAFYGCRSIEVLTLPASVAEIGNFAFYGCSSLRYLPLGETAIRSVGDYAFTNCRELLGLNIPATAVSLGYAMLEGCGALEELALPFVGRNLYIGSAEAYGENVSEETGHADEDVISATTLGYLFGARSYVHTAGYLPASLIRVTLHEGYGDIPPNAFFECSSIREIRLPEGVRSIGRRAFYGCERLSEMTIPDSVTTVGDDAFHGCIRLVDLTVGSGVSQLGVQVFMDCLSLRTVALPASVTYLPNSTFAGCRSLETLAAPGVTSVGRQVFRHCDKLQGWDIAEPTVD